MASDEKNTSNHYLGSRLVARVLKFPRPVKMVIAGLFALATTLAVSPIIDEIYLRFFFNESTVIVPSLISSGVGFVMYIVGWQMIVGTVGEPPDNRAPVMWYLQIGLLALLLVAIWFIRLLAFGNAATTG